MEYIYAGIVGAIICYIFTQLADYFKEEYQKLVNRRKTGELEKYIQDTIFKDSDGYFSIDNAVPRYNEKDISTIDSKIEYILEIPNKFKSELKECGFEYHEVHNNIFDKEIKKCFDFLEISDCDNVIKNTKNRVAENMLHDVKSGKIRFNGYLFGVKSINCNRVTIKENASVKILFYTTDYFTFRVFAEIYQDFKSNFKFCSMSVFNSIAPFLSSFGIGCFLITRYKNIDYVFLGENSEDVIVDQGKIHFTVNETFSMLDRNEYDRPDLQVCLYRGLEEEVGISEEYRQNIQEYGFMDIFIGTNLLETGISCYVKIKFDENFTPEIFEGIYLNAQDRCLETKKIIKVELKKVNDFMKDNKGKISHSCNGSLRALFSRYNQGYIRFD